MFEGELGLKWFDTDGFRTEFVDHGQTAEPHTHSHCNYPEMLDSIDLGETIITLNVRCMSGTDLNSKSFRRVGRDNSVLECNNRFDIISYAFYTHSHLVA